MKTNNEITDEVIEVPMDMAIDIFEIMVRENIPHKVIRTFFSKSTLIIQIRINQQSIVEISAFKNIKSLLDEYYSWRWSNDTEIDWRN
jgi:hypothetical protein